MNVKHVKNNIFLVNSFILLMSHTCKASVLMWSDVTLFL